jgi:hypothetical protein
VWAILCETGGGDVKRVDWDAQQPAGDAQRGCEAALVGRQAGGSGIQGAAGGRRKGRCTTGGWGLGWVMTWMAERPENGTKNKVLYDVYGQPILAHVQLLYWPPF